MGVSWHLNSRASRVSALAMSLGIALAAVGGVVPARAATTTTDPAKAAAGWVATKVEAGAGDCVGGYAPATPEKNVWPGVVTEKWLAGRLATWIPLTVPLLEPLVAVMD